MIVILGVAKPLVRLNVDVASLLINFGSDTNHVNANSDFIIVEL